MKRKIKFRAWTKKLTMQYNIIPFRWDYVIDEMWHKCIESNGPGILGSGGTEAKFEVGGFAIVKGGVMQFTGLKDKNGKEIYEGDIVSVANGTNPVITRCEWIEGQFTLIDNAGGHWTRQLYHQSERLSVRGNIFENPELL